MQVKLTAPIEQREKGAPKICEAYDLMEEAMEKMGVIKIRIDHTTKEITGYGQYKGPDRYRQQP